jgi:hypothetical protein
MPLDLAEHELIVTYGTPYQPRCACGAEFVPQTNFALLATQWLGHIERLLLGAVIPRQE